MTELDQKQLRKTFWNIADQLRGATDDFREYMLSFLFGARATLASGSGLAAVRHSQIGHRHSQIPNAEVFCRGWSGANS